MRCGGAKSAAANNKQGLVVEGVQPGSACVAFVSSRRQYIFDCFERGGPETWEAGRREEEDGGALDQV